MGKKKKKEKIVYVDDGRTVADMSGVSSGPRLSRNSGRIPPRPKEVLKTYFGAVKMMFTPMLVVICALLIIYMILTFVFLFL